MHEVKWLKLTCCVYRKLQSNEKTKRERVEGEEVTTLKEQKESQTSFERQARGNVGGGHWALDEMSKRGHISHSCDADRTSRLDLYMLTAYQSCSSGGQ